MNYDGIFENYGIKLSYRLDDIDIELVGNHYYRGVNLYGSDDNSLGYIKITYSYDQTTILLDMVKEQYLLQE